MKNLEDVETLTWYMMDDEAISLQCECRFGKGYQPFSVFPEGVYRCMECGKGYRAEIDVRIFVYEPDEVDPKYE